ncbi:hypothetical protein EJ110_NYTH35272 [Nymphaea thermarum]|nr:hypothetical protein EJ110_NYTH35272 [Nymphaea thermarum]
MIKKHGYRCLLPITNKMMVSRDVKLYEAENYFENAQQEESHSQPTEKNNTPRPLIEAFNQISHQKNDEVNQSPSNQEVADEGGTQAGDVSNVPQVRHSSRQCRPPVRSKPHRPDLPLPSSSLHDQCTVGVPE